MNDRKEWGREYKAEANSARGAILCGLEFAIERAIITLELWYWPAKVCYCFSLP